LLAQLDDIRVASPCPISWEQMTGDNRVRFCTECRLHVYNFAELTRTEAEDLLRTTEGRLCGRLYRRADGTVITKDCPVGLRAVRRRVAKIATAVFATVVSLYSAAFGQKQSDKDKACKQQVKITTKIAKVPSEGATMTGTLYDQNGAVIAGADVKISRPHSDEGVFVRTNDEGRFSLVGLPSGIYNLLITSPGFKELKVSDVKLAEGQVAVLEATLLVNPDTVGIHSESMGIIVMEEPLQTPNITIFKGTTIQKLPRP
jgi:hypothetical protein